MLSIFWKVLGVIVLIIVLLRGGVVVFENTVAGGQAIAYPKQDHYHFRMQLIENGRAVNFGLNQFQMPTVKTICEGGLTDEPFHFHDSKDQMVHVHWQAVTGGQLLKYYGWNEIGGQDGILGYRLDKLWQIPPKITEVKIHGELLNKPNEKVWIYTGDEKSYQERSFTDFLYQDLNVFFGKKSQQRIDSEKQTSLFETSVHAHHGLDDEDEGLNEKQYTQEELAIINDLVGNVVIFVQEQEPTKDQIQSRFNNLIPLDASVCD